MKFQLKGGGNMNNNIENGADIRNAESTPAAVKKLSKKDEKRLLSLYRKGKVTRETLECYQLRCDSFLYVYSVSRANKLSLFESVYNGLFISSLSRFYSSKKYVTEELFDTFSHPNGWYKNQYLTWKNNFWSRFVEFLQHVPKFIFSICDTAKKLPSAIVRSGHKSAASMDNSFRFFLAVCRAVGKIAKPICIVALVLLLSFTIRETAGSSIALDVYLDGEYIGCVENSDMLTNAKKQLEKSISTPLGTNYRFNDDISFSFVHGKKHDYLTESELFSALYAKASKSIRPAYGLYIDDVLVVASENKAALEEAVREINLFYENSSKQFDDDTSVTYSNSITIVPQDFPTDMLIDELEIRESLGLAPMEVKDEKEYSLYSIYYRSVGSKLAEIRRNGLKQNLTGIAHSATNPDENDLIVPDTLTSSAQVGVTLDYIIVKREKIEEEYPFETEYIKTDALLEGTQKIDSFGNNGTRIATYEISYKNDEEISRELVEESIIKKAKNKIIYVGTRIPSEEEMKTVATGKFIIPCSGYVHSAYGMRTVKKFGTREFHNAWDIPGSYGTSIAASDSGIVSSVGYTSGYGNHVIIDHENGYETIYAHLSKALVKRGERISQGQIIGRMGATGRVTGVHLHFEVRKDGVAINPELVLGEPPKR